LPVPPPLTPELVSIVFPACNEAANLPALLAACGRAFTVHFPEHEIIVVDDGSSDGTPELIEKLARENPRLRLVRHPRNLGYGAALRSGFQAARYPLIFFTDADGQFDPAEVELLLPGLQQSDLVAGYRASRQDPWPRRLYGRLFSALCRWRFGIQLRDVNCAFKLFRRSLLQDLDLTSSGALINAELAARAKRRGIVPIEVPVHHYPRRHGRQSGGSAKVVLRAWREFWELDRRLQKKI
jgi:glycosyltransferase involved in cell wall biosynthesis